MKKNKLFALSMVSLMALPILSGCGKEKQKPTAYFAFSVGLPQGTKTLYKGKTSKLNIYDNGVNAGGKTYTFGSTNPSVATIDSATGTITPLKEGKVSFYATEASKPTEVVSLGGDVDVVEDKELATGGFNFSSTINPDNPADRTLSYQTKAEILGKLEKHAMDSHLTGITLFDNGGLIKYSPRVQLKSTKYITGFGFGLLQDGKIDTSKNLSGITTYKNYYHTSFSQDPLTINQYNATGSQVGDLASYITSTYWSTRRSTKDGQADKAYEWYPVLATPEIKVPTVSSNGAVTYADTATPNNEPVFMEPKNEKNLYKKWRIYVRAADSGDKSISDDKNVIKYSTLSGNSKTSGFNNRVVNIDDYEFIYKLLLTGKNKLKRGIEMAKDTSHGIKGASRFFESTTSATDEQVDQKWTELQGSLPAGGTVDEKPFQATGKLGIRTGKDKNGNFIDIELINAIDPFTAMYTLSSNLVSPLPRDFFKGENSIANDYKKSSESYGQLYEASGVTRNIIDNTLCVAPYALEEWRKNQLILFKLNKDTWFECDENHYTIEGIYNEQVDTSNDAEKVYKHFTNDQALDVTSIPTSKISIETGQDGVLDTEGDSTFKLNVNSCTQEQWNKIFKDTPNAYSCKPWMSNSNFLDGLFFAINRKEFADKRGVKPSLSYFSDSYMANPVTGDSYNHYEFTREGKKINPHEDAISYYHSVVNGVDNYGYDFDRAVDNFRIAVNQLADANKVTLGKDEFNPEEITINIEWMNKGTDIKEYGEDIASYIEKAFNHISVCGGRLKLRVVQHEVTKWEDVYNEYMMKGKFDLAFGAISGNSYDPLNFMEVLKSDNSSTFTLNWSEDTNDNNAQNPIIYNGKKWSYDSLWTVADHGGIAQNGKVVDPIKKCNYLNLSSKDTASALTKTQLYKGLSANIPVEFTLGDNELNDVSFTLDRVDVYIMGQGNTTVWERQNGGELTGNTIKVDIPEGDKDTDGTAAYINEQIRNAQGFIKNGEPQHVQGVSEEEQLHPFLSGKYNLYWSFEVYYTMTIGGSEGVSSELYTEVKNR